VTRTGYNPTRATEHDHLIDGLIAILADRGYQPKLRPVDGDGPDIEIFDHVRFCTALVDLKAPPGDRRYSLKAGAFAEYWRITLNGTPVYIIWAVSSGSFVDNVFTLAARVFGGPRRPTGNGSRTDWMLFNRGGTPFNEFFPAA